MLKVIDSLQKKTLGHTVSEEYFQLNQNLAHLKETGNHRLSQANDPCMDSVYGYGSTTIPVKQLPGSKDFVNATFGPRIPASKTDNPFDYDTATMLECLNDWLFTKNLSDGMLAAKNKLVNVLSIEPKDIGGSDYKSEKSDWYRKCVRSEANGFRLKHVHAMTQTDNSPLMRVIVTLFAIRDMLEGAWRDYTLEETGLLSYLDRYVTTPTYGYTNSKEIFGLKMMNIQLAPRDTVDKQRVTKDWVNAPLKYTTKVLKGSNFTTIQNAIREKKKRQSELKKKLDALTLSERSSGKCRKKSGLFEQSEKAKGAK